MENLLRVEDVAKILDISVSTVWYYSNIGKLPKPLKLLSRVAVWKDSDIESFIESARCAPHRSDSIYHELDNIQLHERTNFVAYQMMIRNDKYKRLQEEYRKLEKARSDIWQKKGAGIRAKTWTDEEDEQAFKQLKENREKNAALQKRYLMEFKVGFSKQKAPFNFTNMTIIDHGEKMRQDSVFDSPETIYFKEGERPFYTTPVFESPDTSFEVTLNLALPKDELFAYVERLKDDYSKQELAKCRTQVLPMESFLDGALKRTYKVGDYFFIYDAKKENITNVAIQKELRRYYNVGEGYGKNEIPEVYKIMESFIDDKKFIDIIKGV